VIGQFGMLVISETDELLRHHVTKSERKEAKPVASSTLKPEKLQRCCSVLQIGKRRGRRRRRRGK
jgi:hypothetical protein